MRNVFAGVGTAIAVLFGLLIVFGSWYTIDQTERGVLLRNGAFVEVVQPGLHFKWPWVESVAKIDMQTHTVTYGYDKAKDKSTMEAYSADQQSAFMRVSVTYHVAPDKVAEVYSRFGGDLKAAVSRVIEPQLYARAKVAFGQYTAVRAISSRASLNSDVAQALTAAMAYDPVFVVETVQVEDISFSPEYIKAVEARMKAEVNVQQERQNLEKEKVLADITVTQAAAQANAVRARAQAEADAIKLRGDAEAQAIEARGKALGVNPSLVALTQAEKWDGKLPATMVPGAGVPMLSLSK